LLLDLTGEGMLNCAVILFTFFLVSCEAKSPGNFNNYSGIDGPVKRKKMLAKSMG
jgi:hypothetical protein